MLSLVPLPAIFAIVTEPSVGVPTSRTLPNAMIKLILSLDVNALENVICEPDTLNEAQEFLKNTVK